MHKDTIKLADFGRSFEKEKDCNNTGAYGIIPYIDSKMFNQGISYKINEKSDIRYSLGLLFWKLTSHSSPFKYEMRKDHTSFMFDILKGLRENLIQNTNAAFVGLYQKCGNTNPDIRQVNSEHNCIDSKTIMYLLQFIPKR
ncbi:hypothetical protein RhiirA5_415973 [Rhizophagus irregularis]|uniref:Protein kinase domain-containing protein n=1 Tax=Rhizophagus irregularis TaxID=588596 RepID=A0A2N0PQS7_9GLOM|nr:hypothetical protein RhiirA5_415973 [Rhizophagus irregularis]